MFYIIIMLSSITALYGMDISIEGIVDGSSSGALEEGLKNLSGDMNGIIQVQPHKSMSKHYDLLPSTMSNSAVDHLITDIKPALVSVLENRSQNQGIDFLTLVNEMLLVRFDTGQRVGNILMDAKIYYIEGTFRTLTISFNYNLETKKIELDQSTLNFFLKIEQNEG